LWCPSSYSTIASEGTREPTDRSVTVGGWSLIIAAVLFMAVFGYLAKAFNYPAVLDGQAAEVLPRGTSRASPTCSG